MNHAYYVLVGDTVEQGPLDSLGAALREARNLKDAEPYATVRVLEEVHAMPRPKPEDGRECPSCRRFVRHGTPSGCPTCGE